MKITLRQIIVLTFWLVMATALVRLIPVAAQPTPAEDPAQDKVGLIVNQPAAFAGYSLVAPMNSRVTYLIDMEGRIVKDWKSEYTPALSAYLLENGHLLRPGAERGFGFGGPGAGGRIQEFNWEGELVWDYSFGDSPLRPHHDICPLPNGNVLVVVSETKTVEEAVAAGRRPETVPGQVLSESILELKPTGKNSAEIVWQWNAWDHLIQDFDRTKPGFGEVSEHPERIDLNFTVNVMDRMMADPQQLARLRTLGYVGGGTDTDRTPRANASARKALEGEPSKNEPQETNKEVSKRQPEDPRGETANDIKSPSGAAPGRFGPGGAGRRGPGPMGGDWLHVNSIAYNPKLDQIMISVHEFSEVWVIDHSTTTAESASREGGRSGKGGDLLYRWGNPRAYRSGSNADQRLFLQHCAHWIADGLPGAGNMLVFNNGQGRPDGVYSSVDEVQLPLNAEGQYEKEEFVAFGPERAAWSYAAADKSSFFSMLISGAQRLPNGNTFICSGNQGLLFEVTPHNEIVWQYRYPGSGMGGPGGFPRGPRPGELVPEFLQQVLSATESQRTSIRKLQSETDSKLRKLLTDNQRKKLAAPQAFFFGPPGGAPPGAPEATENPKAAGNPKADRREGKQEPGAPPPGGPRGFRPPRVGEVLPVVLVERLGLSDDQVTALKQLQQQVDAELGKIWSEDQRAQLKEMENAFAGGPRTGPPGFRPPPGGFGPPGFGPPGFGPPGPGGRPGGGPGGPGGGPGGIFRCYRYGPDFPGLAGRALKPGRKLEEVAAVTPQPGGVAPPRDGK